MIKLNFVYGEKEDVERILYTINRWGFYQQYYNIEWIKLPEKLDRRKIKEYSEHEIIDSVKDEYLNKSIEIYNRVKKEILNGWEKVSEKIEEVFIKSCIKYPEELEIQLTCYGIGGSYRLPNKIVLSAKKPHPLATIVHELIHLTIEDLIQKNEIDQPEKERIVDLFMSKYFSDLFPERVLPKWSQQVYQKIDCKKIDTIFEKFEPDMLTVIKKLPPTAPGTRPGESPSASPARGS